MTKEEARSLMQEAYAGPGNTNEGTFAGDILRACADAIAQMWSMDVDGLARRAFVSTAVGDWLTAVCADRGVERMDGEDDDSLRQRTLKKLSGSHLRQRRPLCPVVLLRAPGPPGQGVPPQKRARHRGCDHRGHRRPRPR